MYFVYLPSFRRFHIGVEDIHRKYVLSVAKELGIPVIDIQNEVFLNHHNPISLFPNNPFHTELHYNADGYRLIADAIGKRIKEDGILYLNLIK